MLNIDAIHFACGIKLGQLQDAAKKATPYSQLDLFGGSGADYRTPGLQPGGGVSDDGRPKVLHPDDILALGTLNFASEICTTFAQYSARNLVLHTFCTE
jgi:hypothetical protein